MGPGKKPERSNMSGPDKATPVPTRIVVHKQSRVLEIEYADGKLFKLPFEFLRVYSPSAEVRGHGPGQEVLQTGKRDVGIDELDAVGNYAVQPHFSDGHDTGIFSWDYMYWLGENHAALWEQYLERMREAGASRDASASASAGVGRDAPAAPAAAPIDAKSVSRPRD
jgi:DUF971 family protein